MVSGTVGTSTLTVNQMPSHTHTKGSGAWSGGPYTNPGLTYPDGAAVMTTDATGGSQSHNHSLSNVTSGNSSSIPPYFSVAYIIRIM